MVIAGALLAAAAIGYVFGLLTGLLLAAADFRNVDDQQFNDDKPYWLDEFYASVDARPPEPDIASLSACS